MRYGRAHQAGAAGPESLETQLVVNVFSHRLIPSKLKDIKVIPSQVLIAVYLRNEGGTDLPRQ